MSQEEMVKNGEPGVFHDVIAAGSLVGHLLKETNDSPINGNYILINPS